MKRISAQQYNKQKAELAYRKGERPTVPLSCLCCGRYEVTATGALLPEKRWWVFAQISRQLVEIRAKRGFLRPELLVFGPHDGWENSFILPELMLSISEAALSASFGRLWACTRRLMTIRAPKCREKSPVPSEVGQLARSVKLDTAVGIRS